MPSVLSLLLWLFEHHADLFTLLECASAMEKVYYLENNIMTGAEKEASAKTVTANTMSGTITWAARHMATIIIGSRITKSYIQLRHNQCIEREKCYWN